MPFLTRLIIKTSLVCFVLALLTGAVILVGPALGLRGFPFNLPALRPVYLHLLMVGWVTQLIIGVGYWMFPKYSQERPRGNDLLAWSVYICLNFGLLLRVVGEPLSVLRPGWGWLLAASAVLQLTAGLAFILNTWPRIKER
ncbi:MAG: hypothetical protein Kow00124_17940 [Anaerolineae bacterium]